MPDELWPTPPFDALVFDCDGTLADNATALHDALARAVAPLGLTPSRGWFDARLGATTRSLIQELASARRIDLDVDLVLDDRHRHYLECLASVGEIPLVASIARAHAGRVPLAVASSGPRPVVAATLDALRLTTLFDAVVTIEDVSAAKPAPDLYLAAADRLGVPASGCVAYEDTAVGAEAARAAGMRVICVPAAA